MPTHKTAGRDRRGCAWLAVALACTIPFSAHAGANETIAAPMSLGDWLASRQPIPPVGTSPAAAPPYLSGLSWRSTREIAAQQAKKRRLIADIDALPALTPAARAARARIAALVSARPATGRVVVARTDGRWLQANPASNPYLEAGDIVTIPDRPSTVTVVRADGTLCTVAHAQDVEALPYVLACDPGASPDVAWIAQPDGTVGESKVAAWNREAQDAPAPGSWIWAPDRGSRWTPDLSRALIEFLATQGVSGLDDDGTPLPAPRLAPAHQTEFLTGAPTRSAEFPVTGGDWGTAGILQTPTARMNDAGAASISVSHVSPYTRLNFTLQPLDWLEIGFRYTDVTNQPYGPASLSGTQTYKDKSIDAKVRLWRESAYLPEVSVGFRDIAGSGLFSGEYVVASKRTGPFDWSAGLGWGYVGARGNLPNPLSAFGHRFDNRVGSSTPNGGELGYSSWFRGRVSPFGGVQYQTPYERLILKAEYDGNDYRHEPFGQVLKERTPFNFGAVFRATRNVDLSLGFERGARVMFGVSLHGNLENASMPKLGNPPPPPVTQPAVNAAPRERPNDMPTGGARSVAASTSRIDHVSPSPFERDWSDTARQLQAQTKWHVRSIHALGTELVVEFDYVDAFYLQDHIDRIAAILNRDAPLNLRTFHVVALEHGAPVADYQVQRAQWLANRTRALPPSEQASAVTLGRPLANQSIDMLPTLFAQPPKAFVLSIGPGYQQTLGGPNGFLLYQVSANAYGELRMPGGAWLGGQLNVGLVDNYNKFTYTASSNLPRVRTYLREYLTTSRVTLPLLQLTKMGRLGDDQFYSVYGGLLESMFAGVGAEWLYRPQGSRLAIGIDANAVRQRGFRQDFSMRGYKTLTGHVTAYWDTGWQGVRVNLSIGRYLAKDKGATLDISRRFRNGVVIGAYATKTDVSSTQFGEGSFDKGIYVTIPFDAMMTRSSSSVANLRWTPVTRDGGAKLDRQYPLYEATDMSDPRSLWYGPPAGAVSP
ncbi:YjbH domain-containing protein [Burkholderia oklahomensis]|uniref:YjbH domain-containing protein n=1 Tax=Burkholderia oklahomensis TaxID=342113 RepID=UPI0034571A23